MTIRRLLPVGFASFTIIFFLILAVSKAQAQVWTASITVKNFDPRCLKTENVSFGVNPDATDGSDPGLDVLTVFPPAPLSGYPYLNVAFAGPNMICFSTDIRPAGPWTLVVGSSDRFTLAWDISSAPADIPLVMVSSDGRTIDMRAVTSVDFPGSGRYSMIINKMRHGDLSGDSKITAFDASLVLQYIVGIITLSPEQKFAADVTGDKTVSALDAVLILQYTVGLITQLPIEPITGAPALVIEQLETVSLDREQKQVLEQLKHLFFKHPPPTKTALLQNYPNPFNPETWIPYELAKEAEVVINIYNIKGELVHTLSIGRQPAGCYLSKEKAVFWNGKNQSGEAVANGLYFYAFKAGEFQATRKMILVK